LSADDLNLSFTNNNCGVILYAAILKYLNSTRLSAYNLVVPWLRRLVTGLPPRRPGFDPRSIHVRFLVDKVVLGQVFSASTSVFRCQFHSIGAPLHGKTKKLIIFITGLHKKPQGCGASVASAAGPPSP
jgi:hypothetical protein